MVDEKSPSGLFPYIGRHSSPRSHPLWAKSLTMHIDCSRLVLPLAVSGFSGSASLDIPAPPAPPSPIPPSMPFQEALHLEVGTEGAALNPNRK